MYGIVYFTDLVHFHSLYTNSSFRSCMKASTLIGLPLLLLLGSFEPTWHLVGTSNIYC